MSIQKSGSMSFAVQTNFMTTACSGTGVTGLNLTIGGTCNNLGGPFATVTTATAVTQPANTQGALIYSSQSKKTSIQLIPILPTNSFNDTSWAYLFLSHVSYSYPFFTSFTCQRRVRLVLPPVQPVCTRHHSTATQACSSANSPNQNFVCPSKWSRIIPSFTIFIHFFTTYVTTHYYYSLLYTTHYRCIYFY